MSLLQKLVNVCLIQPRIRKLKKLLPEAYVLPAGSKWVCDPPPFVKSDIDIQVYSVFSVHDRLIEAGYKLSTSKPDYIGNAEGRINCYRSWSGLTNIIVSLTEAEFVSFSVATAVCKKYNLTVKSDRVVVHSMFRGEQEWSEDHLIIGTYEKHPSLVALLRMLKSPHRETIIKAYRIKYGPQTL